MPNYRRAFQPGGTFFLTLVTADRRPIFADADDVSLLRSTVRQVRMEWPFSLRAAVVLPDHVHWMMELPENDAGFSKRVGRVKALFTKAYRDRTAGSARPTTVGRLGQSEGVWQDRFWEHVIRDQDDFHRHLDYVHYNPVKHGVATCPHGHAASSFQRWVGSGHYPEDWQCVCRGRQFLPPDFSQLADVCPE